MHFLIFFKMSVYLSVFAVCSSRAKWVIKRWSEINIFRNKTSSPHDICKPEMITTLKIPREGETAQ